MNLRRAILVVSDRVRWDRKLASYNSKIDVRIQKRAHKLDSGQAQ